MTERRSCLIRSLKCYHSATDSLLKGHSLVSRWLLASGEDVAKYPKIPCGRGFGDIQHPDGEDKDGRVQIESMGWKIRTDKRGHVGRS